jgi:hypothetical protein
MNSFVLQPYHENDGDLRNKSTYTTIFIVDTWGLLLQIKIAAHLQTMSGHRLGTMLALSIIVFYNTALSLPIWAIRSMPNFWAWGKFFKLSISEPYKASSLWRAAST